MKNSDKKTLGGFFRWLRESGPRTDLMIVFAAAAVIGVVFHLLYPVIFTFPDSGAYVQSAAQDTFNVYRPMGYSDYLGFVHSFWGGMTGLFVVSYLLSALSTIFLLFSARYLMDIRPRWLFLTLCALALLSPRIIFSTNFIMSDGLFNSLTMLFMASAVWLCYSRSLWVIVLHLLAFAALYNVRFSGMFYVPVSVVALWFSFSGSKMGLRLCAAAIPLVAFVLLFASVRKEYVQQTGVDTFSAFSGWQLLNNALVLMPEAKGIDPEAFGDELKPVHALMQQIPDSLFREEYAMTTDYMWSRELAPKLMLFYYCNAMKRDYTQAWVEVGKLYGEYAGALIKNYPGRYLTRFVWPSLLSNFHCYDIVEGTVFRNEPLYADFFGISVPEYKYEISFFRDIYPVRKALNPVWWLALLASAVWFCATQMRKGLSGKQGRMAAGLLLGFLIIYLGSSAMASPCTTWRYTMPMFVPSLVLMAWCLSRMIAARRSRKIG